MNCGYLGFPVGPSLFDLVIDSVTYKAATETANLSTPLEQRTLGDEETVFGLLAYEIPAGNTIPDTPLVYTGQGFNITWTNDW